MHLIITATEAARTFSKVLNKVQYHNDSYEIKRGNEVIAKIIPSDKKTSLPISKLNEFFRKLPKLDEKERDSFLKDINEFRNSFKMEKSKWE